MTASRYGYGVRVVMDKSHPGPPLYCAARYQAVARKDGLLLWRPLEDVGRPRDTESGALDDLRRRGFEFTKGCANGAVATSCDDVLPPECAVLARLSYPYFYAFCAGGRGKTKWNTIMVAIVERRGIHWHVVASIGKMTRRQYDAWSTTTQPSLPFMRVARIPHQGRQATVEGVVTLEPKK